MRAVTLVLAAVALVALPAAIDACSCLPGSLQDRVQSNNHVAKIRVEKILSSAYGQRRYLGYIQQAFNGCLKKGDYIVMTTAEDSATCGVSLSKSKSYLIGADHSPCCSGHAAPVLSLNLCNLNTPWENVQRKERKWLKKYAKSNACCECDSPNGCGPTVTISIPTLTTSRSTTARTSSASSSASTASTASTASASTASTSASTSKRPTPPTLPAFECKDGKKRSREDCIDSGIVTIAETCINGFWQEQARQAVGCPEILCLPDTFVVSKPNPNGCCPILSCECANGNDRTRKECLPNNGGTATISETCINGNFEEVARSAVGCPASQCPPNTKPVSRPNPNGCCPIVSCQCSEGAERTREECTAAGIVMIIETCVNGNFEESGRNSVGCPQVRCTPGFQLVTKPNPNGCCPLLSCECEEGSQKDRRECLPNNGGTVTISETCLNGDFVETNRAAVGCPAFSCPPDTKAVSTPNPNGCCPVVTCECDEGAQRTREECTAAGIVIVAETCVNGDFEVSGRNTVGCPQILCSPGTKLVSTPNPDGCCPIQTCQCEIGVSRERRECLDNDRFAIVEETCDASGSYEETNRVTIGCPQPSCTNGLAPVAGPIPAGSCCPTYSCQCAEGSERTRKECLAGNSGTASISEQCINGDFVEVGRSAVGCPAISCGPQSMVVEGAVPEGSCCPELSCVCIQGEIRDIATCNPDGSGGVIVRERCNGSGEWVERRRKAEVCKAECKFVYQKPVYGAIPEGSCCPSYKCK